MNRQDPLAQLRDIHLPETGGFWPPAPGWWLVGALVLISLAAVLLFWRRHKRNTLWQRQARDLLVDLEQSPRKDSRWFCELNALLKRVARQAFPERNPEVMSGHEWVDFLLETAPNDRIASRPMVEAMVASTWQPRPAADPAQALSFAAAWLETRV
ncbi:DUF4381 domain-containing protein [Marinobacter halophilus]|uniref:DUF4381 domain-containing protein n=1 Tax=Marinobacter halophilus TaxID=1323740 RepID=A0A2T1K9L6_9GAMM|nr:DUF4381 domain-containing protein [Marinobacter halophilus]PSF06730.1 DUF4381 domain-containing protein [Marinobacter halophilus]GGC75044.1 hypothetical protein GCM10011362_24540 [Marinobacter halophilus]